MRNVPSSSSSSALFLQMLGFVLLLAMPGCFPDPSDFMEEEEEKVEEPPVQIDPPDPVAGFQITEIVPSSGRPKGLELVEIRGGGFRDGARVLFGGSDALDVTVTSAGLIYALTPPYAPATVTVTVVNPDGSQAEKPDGYLYYDDVVVDEIDPAIGPVGGGVPIVIRGQGLATTRTVLFEGREALDVNVLDDETVLAVLPAGERTGPVHVHVVTAAQTAKLANAFAYFERPGVNGLAPLYSAPDGGGTLTLTGTGLLADATVSIGGNEAELLATSDDDTRLVVRIPPGELGPQSITISTPYGQVELSDAFVYTDTAGVALVNAWPRSGTALGGDEVSLAVVGLDSPAGLVIRFGDEPAKLQGFDAQRDIILVRSPPGTAGTSVDIEVTLGEETTSLPGAWTWMPGIAVSSVEPSEGSTSGGTRVTVRGSGFDVDGLDVSLGALPVVDLTVEGDDRLSFVSPPGSAGRAALRLRSVWTETTVPDAFTYQAGETRVWAIEPAKGAIAGNTYVTVYGTDLPSDAQVLVGGVPALDVRRDAPHVISFRAPRAQDIGVVDVRLLGTGLDETLSAAYTYFDPVGRFGGTWGDPVDRAVNITVIQSGSDDPIEGVFVALGGDDVPRYVGYTDDRGQVTLSDVDLRGRQTATVAKTGYGASTIAAFDAENATFFLPGPSQPGGGGGGTPLLPGRVDGVLNVPGKYVLMPPWQCDRTPNAHDGLCTPCQTDDHCGESAPSCTRTTNQPPFCSAECIDDAECLAPGEAADGNQNFVCSQLLTAGGGRCIPNPGRAEARCYVSSGSVLSEIPTPDPLAVIDLATSDREFIIENVRLGEVAVYCLAGAVRTIDGTEYFEPSAMGLVRNQFINPGAETPDLTVPTEVELTIDIPLDRPVNVVLGDQPLAPTGPHRTEMHATMDLGSDGYVPMRTIDVDPAAREVSFRGLPRDLSGVLEDVTYAFHAGAVSDSLDTLPTSDVLRLGIDSLDDGRWLNGLDGTWQWNEDGYPGDVLSVVALRDDFVFATTRDGQILTYFGGQWTSQPITTGEALHALSSDHAGGLIAVGERGRVLRWDGVSWRIEESGLGQTLRGVGSLGPDAAIAVGDYMIAESAGETWSVVPFGPPKELSAVSVVPQSDAWAVGRHGAVLRRAFEDGSWSAVDVSVFGDLHGVWSTSQGDVVAVGDDGGIVRRTSAGEWVVDSPPSRRNLRAVFGRAADDVWAVGDAGAVLHFDGAGWTVQGEPDTAISLRGVGGAVDGEQIFALGIHAVHLDPFLTIPRFTSPAEGTLWDARQIRWTDAGGNPSFFNVRIYDATGGLAWTVMAPAFASDIRLPNISAFEPGVLSPGPKRLYLYEVDHVAFDIDAHDNRVFRLADWNAWVQSTFTFDNPTVSTPLR